MTRRQLTQSGAGMVHMYTYSNAPQWQAIAYFLSGFRPCTSPASIACEADAPVHVAHVSKPATAQ